MQETESREAAAEIPKNRGGAAPPHRQCRRIKDSGERCRDWEIRGQGLCFKHGRWEGTRRKGPITVPLMEDEGAILLVVSQTVRAMALGTIPPANGRVMLAGCREARHLLQDKLAARRLEAQMQRWKVVLEDPAPEPMEVVDHTGDWVAPVFDEKEILRKREEEWAAELAARDAARERARAAAAAADTAAEGAAEAEGEAEAVGSALANEPLMPVQWDEPDESGGAPDLFCAEGEKPVELAEWTRTRGASSRSRSGRTVAILRSPMRCGCRTRRRGFAT